MIGLLSLTRLALVGSLVLSCGQVFAKVCCESGDAACLQPYSGNRVGLIVGVDKYNGSAVAVANQLNDLTNAGHDAERVAETLSAQHYSVRCLLNPDIDKFNSELDLLKTYLRTLPHSGDGLLWNNVIVHFSGHGFRVEPADYIFLSGNYPKEKFKANAVRIDELIGGFTEFGHLNIAFVIDACRNVANQPDWMTGIFNSAQSYSPKKNEAHSLIFSTSQTQLARDIDASIGATDNGAFIHVAKKYMDLLFADVELIYQLVAEDPDMVQIKQRPDIVHALFSQAPPLGGASYDCVLASEAATQFGACSRAPVIGPPCDRACKVRAQYIASLRGGSNNGLCTRDLLDHVFPAVQSCAPIDANATVASLLATTPVTAALAPADLAMLRKQVQLVSSQARASNLSVPPPTPAVGPGPPLAGTLSDLVSRLQGIGTDVAPGTIQLSPQQIFDLRARILKASRDAAGATGAFSDAANANWQAPGGPVDLQLLPSTVGGTTGPVRATGTPKVDCQTQYCDPAWVMVRIPTAQGSVDGWIAADKVAPAPAAQSAQLTFQGNTSQLTSGSLKSLSELIEAAQKQPKSFYKIIAVTKPNDDARIQAAARATRVQSLLSQRKISPDLVTVRIVEIENVDDFAPVTIELLK
jgi:hypothetical protein